MLKRFGRIILFVLITCMLGACAAEDAPIDLTKIIAAEEDEPLNEEDSSNKSRKSISKAVPVEETADTEDNHQGSEQVKSDNAENDIREDGYYYDLESVVLYYDKYDRLPSNFIKKNKARALGWERGRLTGYKEGAAIGGDRFGNYERILPDLRGMEYIECDIDTEDASRGEKRLVISNNKRYFYTMDHYQTFREVVVRDGRISFGEKFE